jgi:serine/threonine protein kinase
MAQVPRVERTDQFLGQEFEGKYRVVERLGEGGMSTIYRAQQIEGGPDVALKILHDELVHDKDQRERFEREARALFGLEHPNILYVYDYGVHNGLPFLVMELLSGKTLDQLIEEAPLQPAEAVDLVGQVLTGLSLAHEKGVLHRDIKTENVIVVVDPDGRRVAKLLDFGLVKFVDDDRWGEAKALTAFGEVFGTPAYMSPEQCTGAPTDARTDVYSMGVLLFEMLTGDWPFMGEDRAEMMRAHLTEAPPTLVETRPDLEPRPELTAVVEKALSKNKMDRFASASEMLAALEAIPKPVATVSGIAEASYNALASTSPTMSLPSLPETTAPKKSGLSPILVIGGVAFGAGLLVVVALAIIAMFFVT